MSDRKALMISGMLVKCNAMGATKSPSARSNWIQMQQDRGKGQNIEKQDLMGSPFSPDHMLEPA
jgi:hypothetical protein